MSKTYLPYEPDQQLLLPAALKEWLPDDHLAYFISDVLQVEKPIWRQVGRRYADVLWDDAGESAHKVLSHRPGGRFVRYGEDTSVTGHWAAPEFGEGLATMPITRSRIQIVLANRTTHRQVKSTRGTTNHVVGALSRSHIM